MELPFTTLASHTAFRESPPSLTGRDCTVYTDLQVRPHSLLKHKQNDTIEHRSSPGPLLASHSPFALKMNITSDTQLTNKEVNTQTYTSTRSTRARSWSTGDTSPLTPLPPHKCYFSTDPSPSRKLLASSLLTASIWLTLPLNRTP